MVISNTVFDRSMQRGQDYAAENEWAKALVEYERAVGESPDDVGARGNLALALFQVGRWKDAIREYEVLAKAIPNNITVLDHLVAAYVNDGDRINAEKLYWELAQLYVDNHRLPAAIETLERLVQLAPENAEAYERLASLYEQKEDSERAAECCLSLAKLHATAGRWIEATKYAERALALDGKNAASVLLLTEMSKRRDMAGQSAQSQASLDETERVARHEQFNQLMKAAESLTMQGRYDDAVEKYQSLINAGLDEPRVRYSMALLHQQSNQIEKAIGQYALITHDKEYGISAFYGLGECYESLGQYQPAGEYYERAISLIDVKNLRRAELDELVQMYDKATEAYVRLGDHGRAASLYDTLASNLLARGGVAERAEQIRQKAAALTEQSMIFRLRRLDSSSQAPEARKGSQSLARGTGSLQLERLAGKVTGPLRPITYFLPPIALSESQTAEEAPAQQDTSTESEPAAQAQHQGCELETGPRATAIDEAALELEPEPEQQVVTSDHLEPDALEGEPHQAGLLPDSDALLQTLEQPNEEEIPTTADVSLLESPAGQLVADGDSYRKSGLYSAALDRYLEALNRHPNYLALHFRLADVYLSQGRAPEALEKYSSLASVLELRDDSEELVRAYRRILHIQPTNTGLREKLVALLHDRGDYPQAASEAVALVETLLSLDQQRKAGEIAHDLSEYLPDTARERLAYGQLLCRIGDYPSAVSHFQRAKELGCHAASAETGIIISLIMTGEDDDGWMQLLDSLCVKVKRQPVEADQIIADFEAAIIRRTAPELLYSLGRVHAILDRHAEANLHFGSAIEHLSSGSELFQLLVHYAYAESLMAQQQTDTAVPQFLACLELWTEANQDTGHGPFANVPSMVTLYESLADCYLHQGDGTKAIECLQQAKLIATDRFELHERLASLYVSTGQLDLAADEFSALASLQECGGKTAQACQTLVRLSELDLNARDDSQRIINLCRQSGSPAAVDELVRLATLHSEADMAGQAIQEFYEAARLFWQMKDQRRTFATLETAVGSLSGPANAPLRHELINLYLATKDKTRALDHLRKAANTAIQADRTNRAITYLHRILSLAPLDVPSHYQLAGILVKLSEYGQAAILYARLMKLQPSNLKVAAVYNQVSQLAAKKRQEETVETTT